jgi:uncharacterized glyoxalase superfamily protein PhnB
MAKEVRTMAVKFIPEGFHTVTPYLTVDDPAVEVDFLQRAFDGKVTFQMKDDKGNIGHAEVKVGDSMLMLGPARDEWHPKPTNFYVYVPDCDAVYKKAIAAGGKSLHEPANQFYGDRHGGVEDPQGNVWWIATHIEDVSQAEMERRARTASAK